MREAQRELEISRQRYADLYDLAPVGYLSLTRSGGIREINLAGARMLGMGRSPAGGRPPADVHQSFRPPQIPQPPHPVAPRPAPRQHRGSKSSTAPGNAPLCN